MIRILASALAAGMLLAASQASATDEPSAATAVASPPTAAPAPRSHTDPNEVICKRQEMPGTRLGGSKICHTRQEWAEISASARTAVDHIQAGATLTPQR